MWGPAARSHELAIAIEARIDAVRTLNRSRSRPRTLVIFGRDAFALRGIYASGGIGFVHDMLTAAGGDNVFADVKRKAVQATTELIIARRPDVILELRADPIAAVTEARELNTWAALRPFRRCATSASTYRSRTVILRGLVLRRE